MICRSWLFVPGNVNRRVAKALNLDADVVILDLEDAVPVSEKATARDQIAGVLKLPRKCICYVRVNALGTGLTIDDLNAVMGPDLDGVILAKVESSGDLEKVDWYMSYLEIKNSLRSGSIDLVPLVENARGIENAYDIAKSVSRVKRLCFGAIDYSLDVGIKQSPEATEILYARSRLVNTSKAARIEPPIDTVYPDIKDFEGMAKDIQMANSLGFQGKIVIHPDQIGPVNKAFSPSIEDIAYAREVIDAFTEAEAQGQAAIMLKDGKFIDYPVVYNARRILALAEKLKQ